MCLRTSGFEVYTKRKRPVDMYLISLPVSCSVVMEWSDETSRRFTTYPQSSDRVSESDTTAVMA